MLVTNQTTQDYWFGPLHLDAGVGQTLTVDDTSDTSLYLTDDAVADLLNNLYNGGKITVSGQAQPFPRPTGTPQLLHGDGSPEGAIFAPQGSLYMRRDGTGPNSLYVKTTGVTLNTGWEPFGSAVGGPGTEWDYAQITANSANITATTEGTAISIITGNTVTYDGTRVKLEFYAPWIGTGTSTNVINIVFLRDSTVLGHAVIWQSGTSSVRFSSPAVFFETPPAGSHTYAVKAYCDVSTGAFIGAGPGGAGSLLPAFMRVTKA